MDLKSCACCGEKTLPAANISYICPICGWEDDEIQNLKPDYDDGANHISLNVLKKPFPRENHFSRSTMPLGIDLYSKKQRRL